MLCCGTAGTSGARWRVTPRILTRSFLVPRAMVPTGIRVLEARGRFMQEACLATPGAMMSVIGAEAAALEKVCAQSGAEQANLNSHEQVVLSGTKEAIDAAERVAREMGIRKLIRLNVAGAFHSTLMRPAADRLQAVKWRNWKLHFYRQDTMFDPPIRNPVPTIYNLYTDPREEKPTPDSWVVGPVLKIVGEFERSVKQHPLIPMGTPDPYRPGTVPQ